MNKLNHLFTLENVSQENAQKLFSDKAIELFEHCSIKQGKVEYKFLEVEFYFWSETHQDNRYTDKKDDKKRDKDLIYKRSNIEPAQYFIHNSGMDLCLKSEKAYGGILIRTLLRIDENGRKSVVLGPLGCCDAIINYTGGTSQVYPVLTYNEIADANVKLGEATRCNLPNECPMKDSLYCFYNKAYHVDKNKWEIESQVLERYDPRTGKLSEDNYTAKPWKREVIH